MSESALKAPAVNSLVSNESLTPLLNSLLAREARMEAREARMEAKVDAQEARMEAKVDALVSSLERSPRGVRP